MGCAAVNGVLDSVQLRKVVGPQRRLRVGHEGIVVGNDCANVWVPRVSHLTLVVGTFKPRGAPLITSLRRQLKLQPTSETYLTSPGGDCSMSETASLTLSSELSSAMV
jgi:hypothetical protein